MADITAEIDLDSVIDRLLEGELASPKTENMFPSRHFEMFLQSGFLLFFIFLLLYFSFICHVGRWECWLYSCYI